MSANKRLSELQESYHAMVDSVEEFVVKEGKTLQQAFHAAEEKLGETAQISKEKIQLASKELKDHLRLWGDVVEGVSEAYKDQIKFDLAYVNSSAWSKLQSIANASTTELLEFTTTLKNTAQDAVTENHKAAHQEHNLWASEHALWLDEVAFWKKEHEQAITKLKDIERVLEQQSSTLSQHVNAIQEHAKSDDKHEKIMKAAEQDSSSNVFEEADRKEISVHQHERQLHAKTAEAHHALKTHHFKTMAMINMLYKETHKVE
ncbi:hypothetical protein Patl_1959 [Paraglaciecola sp. T6c]|uniref:zinc ribbon-containing protein n=1 Tax=Pseudoalteromonas atlantica (strain T6c / ATCC BAA-1087) TaxID=3042615 RepID=UPI00005C52BD|nr:hypothetical protein [Paraglaciecola sp. T6c]ABG40477.1 hypothetical protein Patl_1959 [Paraglaciecola sp. T6c]